MMIPERVVKQYLAYCNKSGCKPLSTRSTLLHILPVCHASTRKSLQGLDYTSSAGAQAFEDLGTLDKAWDGPRICRLACETENDTSKLITRQVKYHPFTILAFAVGARNFSGASAFGGNVSGTKVDGASG